MFVRLLFLLFSFCSFAQLHPTEFEQKESRNIQESESLAPFATNGVFVFLGPRQENQLLIDAVAGDVMVALHQKAGPLLISSALMKSIMLQPSPEAFLEDIRKQGRKDVALYEAVVNLRKQIKEYLKTIPSNPSQDEEKKIAETVQQMGAALRTALGDYNFAEFFKRALVRELITFEPDSWLIKQVNPPSFVISTKGLS